MARPNNSFKATINVEAESSTQSTNGFLVALFILAVCLLFGQALSCDPQTGQSQAKVTSGMHSQSAVFAERRPEEETRIWIGGND